MRLLKTNEGEGGEKKVSNKRREEAEDELQLLAFSLMYP